MGLGLYITCDCPDKCVIKGKCISLRKILCKCDVIRLGSVTFMKICDPTTRTKNIQASNTSSVTCDTALKLQTASTAIAVDALSDCRDALKNVAFHGNILHCRRALFLHARPKFLSQKCGNKIIKIAWHGSAQNDACAAMHSIQYSRRA